MKGFENANTSILIFIAELQVLPISYHSTQVPSHKPVTHTHGQLTPGTRVPQHQNAARTTLTNTHASRAARARCVQTHAGGASCRSRALVPACSRGPQARAALATHARSRTLGARALGASVQARSVQQLGAGALGAGALGASTLGPRVLGPRGFPLRVPSPPRGRALKDGRLEGNGPEGSRRNGGG